MKMFNEEGFGYDGGSKILITSSICVSEIEKSDNLCCYLIESDWHPDLRQVQEKGNVFKCLKLKLDVIVFFFPERQWRQFEPKCPKVLLNKFDVL